MRKLYAIVSLFLVLAFASPSFAAVGLKIDGVDKGAVTDLGLKGNVGSISGGVLNFNLLLAGTANGGATSMTTTETAVPVAYSLVRKSLSPTVGVAGTLADGSPGQILSVFITAVSGSGTFILTPTTKTGFTTLTFDAAKDMVTLLFVDTTVGWIIIGNVSVTVAIP